MMTLNKKTTTAFGILLFIVVIGTVTKINKCLKNVHQLVSDNESEIDGLKSEIDDLKSDVEELQNSRQ